jgi:hypothetical protein
MQLTACVLAGVKPARTQLPGCIRSGSSRLAVATAYPQAPFLEALLEYLQGASAELASRL